MSLYFALTVTSVFKTEFFPFYAHWLAECANPALRMLGQNISISGAQILSPEFSVVIASGCDGLAPLAIFVSAVLSFPRPVRAKIAGLLCGSITLWAANYVRIISLFLLGRYYPAGFRVMHEDIWQACFILLSTLCWLAWLRKTQPAQPPTVNALD